LVVGIYFPAIRWLLIGERFNRNAKPIEEKKMHHEYDSYNEAFQLRLLALLVQYPEDSLSLIVPSYFQLLMHTEIARTIHEAYSGKQLNSTRLTMNTLRTLVLKRLRKKNKEAFTEKKPVYLGVVRKLFVIQLPDHEIILAEARDFALAARYRNALVEAEKLINAKNYDSVLKLFAELETLRRTKGETNVLPVSILHRFLRNDSQFEEEADYLVYPIINMGIYRRTSNHDRGKCYNGVAQVL
jgi:hypothetical protein